MGPRLGSAQPRDPVNPVGNRRPYRHKIGVTMGSYRPFQPRAARPGQPEPLCVAIAGGDASATRKAVVVVPHRSYIVSARLALDAEIAANADSWTIQLYVGATKKAEVALTDGLAAETSLAFSLEADVDLDEGDVIRAQAVPDDAENSPDLPSVGITIGITAR